LNRCRATFVAGSFSTIFPDIFISSNISISYVRMLDKNISHTTRHAQLAANSRKEFIEDILKKVDDESGDKKNELKEKIERDKEQLQKLDLAFTQLYEDRLEGNITERNFNMMSKKLSSEQNDLIKRIEKSESEYEQYSEEEKDLIKFVSNLSRFAEIQELTRYNLNQIIDVIYIHEPEEINGEKVQNVEIHYKFFGKIG
ncbi:MAG: DUF4368 domain-containing protein, partial [Clostridiales bacterium]|nr:DUF4368 domain-containing protein [Clostridiales bacterium]